MKSIFKFMGIALMATSLMVACTKDEPADTNTDDTTSTNTQDPQDDPQPQGPANVFTLTWNGESKAMAFKVAQKMNNQLYGFMAYENSTNGQPEGFAMKMYFMYQASTGKIYSVNEGLELTLSDGSKCWSGDYLPSDVFEQGGYNDTNSVTGRPEVRGDYRFLGFLSVDENTGIGGVYGAFDATQNRLTCTLNMRYYSYAAWRTLYDALDPEAADFDTQVDNLKYQVTDTKDLVVSWEDFEFVQAQ